MRCSRCRRPLTKATVTSGSLAIGPRCAQIMGIAIGAPRVMSRRAARAAPVHPGQLPLFEGDVQHQTPVGVLA